MRLPKFLTPHTVTVKPYLGEGANGPIHGPSTVVEDVYVEEVAELVLDDTGAEVVSRGKVFFNLDDAPLHGSLVTTWPGTPQEQESVAFRVARLAHKRPASHAVAYLR